MYASKVVHYSDNKNNYFRNNITLNLIMQINFNLINIQLYIPN